MRRLAVLLGVLFLFAIALLAPASQPADAGSGKGARFARPGVYVFYDWRHLDPQTAPLVGGHVTVQWKTLETGPRRYDWGWLNDFLDRDRGLGKVTGVGLDPYDGPCCGGDGTPEYLAARPNLTVSCGGETIPRYWHPDYQAAYGRFIQDFGDQFNGDPRIAFLQIGVGLFGETQPARDVNDECLLAAGLTPDAWLGYARWAMDAYLAAFPDTPLVLEYAPRYGNVCQRRELADYAASRGIGLQHSGLVPDGGGGAIMDTPGEANYGCGQYDPLIAWEGHTLIGWEGTEWGEHRGPGATLWRLYNGLEKHPDFILLDDEQVADPQRRAYIEFANRYAGRTIADTPGVWAALRETEFDWYPERGNYEFWLYQLQDAAGGQSVALRNVGVAPEGRYARRTDEATGNPYLVFDVDDRYLHGVASSPVTVTVTYLDAGFDTWALEYDARRDAAAPVASEVITKTGTGLWLTATFHLDDARFANGLDGGDFRIAGMGDGDEIVHFVFASGDERSPVVAGEESAPRVATPTPTPLFGHAAPTPSAGDLRLIRTPVPGPWPEPNSVSAYGSVE